MINDVIKSKMADSIVCIEKSFNVTDPDQRANFWMMLPVRSHKEPNPTSSLIYEVV